MKTIKLFGVSVLLILLAASCAAQAAPSVETPSAPEPVREVLTAETLERSPVMAEIVENRELLIVGGVHDLASGRVNWLES